MQDLLTVDEALACILDRASALPTEVVPVESSLGRVVREPVISRTSLPPFASSAMDGFAVRAADTPGALPVTFRVAAGRPSADSLSPGTAAGVATGGVVPNGADAVVPVELVVDHGERIEVSDATVAGRNVRPRGGDVEEGDVVLAAGTIVRASHVGALAAVGTGEVVCSVRPRVAVLATGSELQPPGEPLPPGGIYESNRAMLAAALAPTGAVVEVLPVVEDELVAHRTALERALQADVVVSSGGVSMGPHDLVRSVARELGVEEVFWGVAMRPGKPLSFGTRGSTLLFGLPGNPVSSLVGALVFVRTALWALQAAERSEPPYLVGRTRGPLARNSRRDEFVRARSHVGEDAVVLEALPGQESHMIVRAAAADALVHVPRGDGEISAGAVVRYLTID